MKKRLAALLCTVCAAAMMAGCGTSGDTAAAESTDAATEDTAEETGAYEDR